MGISTGSMARADRAPRASLNDNDMLSADALRAELARCRLRLQRAASQVSLRNWSGRVRELGAALAHAERR